MCYLVKYKSIQKYKHLCRSPDPRAMHRPLLPSPGPITQLSRELPIPLPPCQHSGVMSPWAGDLTDVSSSPPPGGNAPASQGTRLERGGWHGGPGPVAPVAVMMTVLAATSVHQPSPLCSGPPPLVFTHHYFFLKDLLAIVHLLQLSVFILMGGVPHEATLHHRCLYLHLLCGGRQEAPLHAVQAANNIRMTPILTPLIPASCLCPSPKGLRPKKGWWESHLSPLEATRACGVPHPICDDIQLNFLKASVCQDSKSVFLHIWIMRPQMSFWKLNCLNFRSLCSRGPTSMLSLPAELTHSHLPHASPGPGSRSSPPLRASGASPGQSLLSHTLPGGVSACSSLICPAPTSPACSVCPLHSPLAPSQHEDAPALTVLKSMPLWEMPLSCPSLLFPNSGPYSRTFCPARVLPPHPAFTLTTAPGFPGTARNCSEEGQPWDLQANTCISMSASFDTSPSPSPALSVSEDLFSPLFCLQSHLPDSQNPSCSQVDTPNPVTSHHLHCFHPHPSHHLLSPNITAAS